MGSLEEGFFVRWAEDAQFGHKFGGKVDCRNAQCPNCEKSLMLHLTLDCSDDRLGLADLGLSTLPLFYCMRCALCWSDLVYEIHSSDEIELLSVCEGELMEEWYSEGNGDSFVERAISLERVPEGFHRLAAKLNNNEKLSEEEILAYATATENFSKPEFGGGPGVDVINQVLGCAFLQQRLDNPDCELCDSPMSFLASLCNDARNDVKVAYEGGQIVFFLCKHCKTINVQSSA